MRACEMLPWLEFEILASEDCYIDLSEIVQKVKLELVSS